MNRLLLASVLLLSCNKGEEITGIQNQPGGNPIVPEYAMFPMPSDFYLQDDATTRTGKRLAIPAEAMPGDLRPDVFAHADGWPRSPVMLTWLPDLDPAALPHPLDEDATLADDSPIVVVRMPDLARVPVLAELDATAADQAQRSLILRPHLALDPATTYVVLLRDTLTATDGSTYEANKAFRALRDDIPTNSDAVEAQRDDFVVVNQAIAGLGFEPDSVIQGWSFSTRSREQVVNPLLSMADTVMAAELGDVVVVSDEVDDDNRIVTLTVEAPWFIGDDGLIALDADDNAIQNGTQDILFIVTIPDTVTVTRPGVLFGHGFFSHREETTWGSLQQLTHPAAFPTVSTNFIGFNEEDQTASFTILADFNRTAEISAQQMQSQANHVALARVMREQLPTAVTLGTGDPVIDVDHISYMGISNGGTQGFTIMTIAPNLDRGVLVVPGGALTHMLQRASPWTTLGAVIATRFDDPRDLQAASGLFQVALDPWDSINFVDHMVEPRFAGREQEVKVVLHEAVADAQVSNMITHWLARTAGVPVFAPNTLEPWGLQPIEGATHDGNSALYIYDEGYDPLPLDNTPPVENGAHETIRDLTVYKDHVTDFIEDGSITYTCAGACDPE